MTTITTTHRGHRYLYRFPAGREHIVGARIECDWQAGKLPIAAADDLLDQLEAVVERRVKARAVTVKISEPPRKWLDQFLEWCFGSECSGK